MRSLLLGLLVLATFVAVTEASRSSCGPRQCGTFKPIHRCTGRARGCQRRVRDHNACTQWCQRVNADCCQYHAIIHRCSAFIGGSIAPSPLHPLLAATLCPRRHPTAPPTRAPVAPPTSRTPTPAPTTRTPTPQPTPNPTNEPTAEPTTPAPTTPNPTTPRPTYQPTTAAPTIWETPSPTPMNFADEVTAFKRNAVFDDSSCNVHANDLYDFVIVGTEVSTLPILLALDDKYPTSTCLVLDQAHEEDDMRLNEDGDYVSDTEMITSTGDENPLTTRYTLDAPDAERFSEVFMLPTQSSFKDWPKEVGYEALREFFEQITGVVEVKEEKDASFGRVRDSLKGFCPLVPEASTCGVPQLSLEPGTHNRASMGIFSKLKPNRCQYCRQSVRSLRFANKKDKKGNLKVVGLELAHGGIVNGEHFILAAGYKHTPEILMNSGIGTSAGDFKFPYETPGVGRNMHDDLTFDLNFDVVPEENTNRRNGVAPLLDFDDEDHTRESFEHLKAAGGVLHVLKFSSGLYGPDFKDVQVEVRPMGTDRMGVRVVMYRNKAFTESGVFPIRVIDEITGRPSSTVSWKINASVQLCDKQLAAATRGYQMALRIVSKMEKDLGITLLPDDITNFLMEAFEQGPEAFRTELVESHLELGYHAGGTCKLGECTETDFRVKGTENVHVCDMSLLPTPVDANPTATLFALGAKFARDYNPTVAHTGAAAPAAAVSVVATVVLMVVALLRL